MDSLAGAGFSICGGASKDWLETEDGMEVEIEVEIEGEAEVEVEDGALLAASCEASPDSTSCSVSFSLSRLGDGDLDVLIHDFRANVANDSDTFLGFSR